MQRVFPQLPHTPLPGDILINVPPKYVYLSCDDLRVLVKWWCGFFFCCFFKIVLQCL